MPVTNKRFQCIVCEKRKSAQAFARAAGERRICQQCQRREINYAEIDANLHQLIRILNRFPGLETIGSCGGHPEPRKNAQWPEGSYYVKFTLPANPTGWYVLEFLAWLINNDIRRTEHQIVLLPTAAPPFINRPGQVLCFCIEGEKEDPEFLAELLERTYPKLVLQDDPAFKRLQQEQEKLIHENRRLQAKRVL